MGFAVPVATGVQLARGTGRAIVLVLDNHGYGAERSIADGPFNGAVVGTKGTRVRKALGEALAELMKASS